MSIWDYLRGDVGHWEYQRLNESFQMMMEADSFQAEYMGEKLRKLFALDKAQSRELAALRTMVRVLSDAVVELGYDRERLTERLEAEVKALEDEDHMTKGSYGPGGPYRGSTAQGDPKGEEKSACVTCAKEVLLRRTYVTESGTVCDTCFHA